MTSPYVADPARPTDDELAAAIARSLEAGTLIDASEWMARNAGYATASPADRFTAQDGTAYVMDTATRYDLAQARAILHRDLGRKHGTLALFRARRDGDCTIGGTRVIWDGRHFAITDAF